MDKKEVTNFTGTTMNPDEIRWRLMKALGRRFAAIIAERAGGKTSQWTSRHISGQLYTDRGRQLISEAIGIPVDEIWPSKTKEEAAA